MQKRFSYIYLMLLFSACYITHAQDSLSLNAQRSRDFMLTDLSLTLQDSSALNIFLVPNLQDATARFRISSVKKNVKSLRGGGGSSTHLYYQGELLSGVAHLLNTNIFYIRTKGKIPDEYIYYYGMRSFLEQDNVRETISNILKDKYKFKILDIEDSCEVWRVHKIDTTKLILYEPEKHGMDFGSGTDDIGKNFFCIGFPLSFLYSAIEWQAKIIVTGDTFDDNWDNRYYFDKIPYSLMTDLDGLNKFLEERYGIKFIKTKIRQKLKLIDFGN